MRLDPDIVRAVLMKTAELPFDGSFHAIEVEGCSEEALNYHIMILEQAGLLAAEDLTTLDGICWQPKYLTYEGNEFLSAAERDTVWAKEDDGHERSEDCIARSIEGRPFCCDESHD